MAKNTNKTEHVLKLITTGEENAAEEKKSSGKSAKRVKEKVPVPDAEAPDSSGQDIKPMEQHVLPPSEQEHGPADDEDKIVVKNVVEGFVEERLPEVIGRMKCCQCDSCLNDIRAIALNSLPPRYIATRKGELFSKAASYYIQYEADVIAAITRAVVVVATRPRHS